MLVGRMWPKNKERAVLLHQEVQFIVTGLTLISHINHTGHPGSFLLFSPNSCFMEVFHEDRDGKWPRTGRGLVYSSFQFHPPRTR